jgi:hypothetical protein
MKNLVKIMQLRFVHFDMHKNYEIIKWGMGEGTNKAEMAKC